MIYQLCHSLKCNIGNLTIYFIYLQNREILNPPCISLDSPESRASKISCVCIDTDTETPYEELGYVMMEAEKFPDVPSASWRTRRAVAHLSQKACEPAEPACEFQSESWQFRDPRGVDVSAQVQRPERAVSGSAHQAGDLSQSALFAVFTPAGGGQSALLNADSDANLIQKPLQTTPRMMLAESRTDTL